MTRKGKGFSIQDQVQEYQMSGQLGKSHSGPFRMPDYNTFSAAL